MFTNDLLQSQLSLGAYPGAANPFSSPFTALQTAINPAAFNPQTNPFQNLQTGQTAPFGQPGGISPFGQQGYAGIPNYAAIAQQQQQLQQQVQQQLQQLQQLASILASQGGIPQMFGAPHQPNPWQTAQQLGLQPGSVYGQPQYGQIGLPFAQAGYPLAPQSWVGQQGPGQIHPHHLSQLAARGLY